MRTKNDDVATAAAIYARQSFELAGKPPSLHDPPPAPSKHLTRCLRNRVQASHRAWGFAHSCQDACFT
jgi:hypothetical protein